MSCVLCKPGIGAINGVNKIFQTSTDYKTGTLRVWTSSMLWDLDAVELGGKDVELSEAPLPGDSVFLWFVVP